MLIRHRDHEPYVHETAWVAPNATLVGNVVVGPRVRIMYGAIVDSEGSRVEIGESSVIAEHAVLRATAVGDEERPVVLGDHNFVGPHATVLGAQVGRCCYLAAHGTVLHGATLGDGAVIAVGALVHARTNVPGEYFVPPHTVAVGDPLSVLSPDQRGEVEAAIRDARFAEAAFGVDAAWENRVARYERTADVRAAEFGAHADDTVLDD
jgi:carbonic anhydrase/acetyltransferase-like protein (isoleucine patch superfamily)